MEKVKNTVKIEMPSDVFEKEDSTILLFDDKLAVGFYLNEEREMLRLVSFVGKAPEGLEEKNDVYRLLLTANMVGAIGRDASFGLEVDEDGDESVVYASSFSLVDAEGVEDLFIAHLELFLQVAEQWQTALTSDDETIDPERAKAFGANFQEGMVQA